MKLASIDSYMPKILLTGIYGTGKTALAQTLGAGTILLDLDQGAITGRNLKDKWFSRRNEIEVLTYTGLDPGRAYALTYEKARAQIAELSQMWLAKKLEYRAIILDNLTAFLDMGMQRVMSLKGMPLDKPPGRNEWSPVYADLEYLLRLLKCMTDRIIVVIAHLHLVEIADKDNPGETISRYNLAIRGKVLGPRIPLYFDEVWNMHAHGKGVYRVQTAASSSFPARSRHCLPDQLDANVGMPGILKLMGIDWK